VRRFDPHIDPLAYAKNEAVFKQQLSDQDRQHVVRLSESDAKSAYRRLRHSRFNGTQEINHD
jgi:hypothetical protein